VPAWVESAGALDDFENLLPQPPQNSLPALHLGTPISKNTSAPRGRQFDHLRDEDPVVESKPAAHTAPRWHDYAHGFEGEALLRGQVMDDQWLGANMPTYEDPSHVGAEQEKEDPGFWLFTSRKRTRKMEKFQVCSLMMPR
jgi:hypothetical protein